MDGHSGWDVFQVFHLSLLPPPLSSSILFSVFQIFHLPTIHLAPKSLILEFIFIQDGIIGNRGGVRMSECRISETIENNPRGKRDGNVNRITSSGTIGHTARVPVASQPVARANGGGHFTLCIVTEKNQPSTLFQPRTFVLRISIFQMARKPGWKPLSRHRETRLGTSNRSFIWSSVKREREREIFVGARSPRLPRLYKLPVRRGNLTCTPAAVRKGYDPTGTNL